MCVHAEARGAKQMLRLCILDPVGLNMYVRYKLWFLMQINVNHTSYLPRPNFSLCYLTPLNPDHKANHTMWPSISALLSPLAPGAPALILTLRCDAGMTIVSLASDCPCPCGSYPQRIRLSTAGRCFFTSICRVGSETSKRLS